MKKALKIFGKLLLLLMGLFILAMIIVPVAFKGRLMDMARTELNNSVNARVDFADLRISLIRSFPRLNVSLEGLAVVGEEPFAGDTLVGFRSFQVAVNPFGLIGNKGIEISRILLDQPVIHAMVLKNGTANWDIVPETTDTLVEEPADTVSSGMPGVKVQLKKFEIRDASVSYVDREGDMSATLDHLNFLMKGKWAGSTGSLFTQTTIGAVNVTMGKIRYVKNAVFRFRATLGADMASNTYTFKDNELALNDLALGFDGKITIKGEAVVVDASFHSKETSFKSLLSLVPAIYMNDFGDLQTKGTLALDGTVRGSYLAADSTYPVAVVNLKVSDASFAYPGLPESVRDVNIDVKLVGDGTHPDLSTVDVNRFDLKLGENPFHASFHIRQPVSDPGIKGVVRGTIDLATLTDAIPLDSTELSGLILADMKLGGKMSMIENEQYASFTADGSIMVKDVVLSTPVMKDRLEIPSGRMFFSPRYVDLEQLKIVSGPSDMTFSGKLEQFIPYMFSDGTVKGRLDFSSTVLDLNRLMPETPATAEADTAMAVDTLSEEPAAVEVPDKMDFVLEARMGLVKYGNIEARNVAGKILVKDRKVIMENVSMEAMDGSVALNGEYSTQKPGESGVSMDVEAKDISIPGAYNALVTVRKLAPFASGLDGKVSSGFSFSGLLDKQMMPILKTVNAYGKLQSSSVSVLSAGVFDKIKGLLKLNPAYTNQFKDLNISFRVENGMLHVSPFHTRVGNIDMIISGEQGLDQSVKYVYDIKVPRKDLGNKANELITGLFSKAAQQGLNVKVPETIHLKAFVTGTVKNPKVSLKMGEQSGPGTEQVKEMVKEKVTGEVKKKADEEKEKIKNEADVRAERFLVEARKKYEEALKAAGEERDRAYQRADTLEKKASGGIVQKLKVKAQAEALRKGADAAYKQAVKFAENQYKKAEAKAEEIRKKVRDL